MGARRRPPRDTGAPGALRNDEALSRHVQSREPGGPAAACGAEGPRGSAARPVRPDFGCAGRGGRCGDARHERRRRGNDRRRRECARSGRAIGTGRLRRRRVRIFDGRSRAGGRSGDGSGRAIGTGRLRRRRVRIFDGRSRAGGRNGDGSGRAIGTGRLRRAGCESSMDAPAPVDGAAPDPAAQSERAASAGAGCESSMDAPAPGDGTATDPAAPSAAATPNSDAGAGDVDVERAG